MKKQVGPYAFVKTIGKGHYAYVYQARNTETNELVAIKCLKREGVSQSQLKNIENEVLVLEKSRHPSII